ncbi:MAG: M28 family peptidase [Elusimicrobia bacterium]|nr:M28 family peptidase [Elusimicrobiota bacterium]
MTDLCRAPARLLTLVLVSSAAAWTPPAAAAGQASPESYAILKGIVKFGNRHAGASKRGLAVDRLARLLSKRGLETEKVSFESPDPRTGRMWPMTNIVARFRPEASCRFLLGSHFDARHEAEMDPDPARKTKPIAGANDSGSGVAVLVALASRFRETVPKGVGVDVVLFDGEEMGYPDVGGYCAGSRQFAGALTSRPSAGTRTSLPIPKFGIVLDMVASPKSVFKVESYSQEAHPSLVSTLWEIGTRRMPAAFSRERLGWIRDDHFPLIGAGVPSVLVIGYNDPRWHTAADVFEGLSPERLALVEGLLEEFMKDKLSSFLGGCP